jgi:Ca2+-binding EF-hand superfamily protein
MAQGPLTPEEMERVKGAFDALDASGDGKITKDDIKTLLTNAQWELTDEEIEGLVGMIEIDEVTWDQFLAWAETRPIRTRIRARLTQMFHNLYSAFDIDGTGYISLDNLQTIAAEAGLSPAYVTSEQIEEKFNEVDAAGDGKVSFEEFMDAIFAVAEALLE